ncbi:hypothetical protein TELCIR_14878, partial [Teladorsagia circumcincta]
MTTTHHAINVERPRALQKYSRGGAPERHKVYAIPSMANKHELNLHSRVDAVCCHVDIVSKCKGDSITHIWINTKPSGRILAQTRHLKQA